MMELLVAISVNVLVGALTALLIYFLRTRKRDDPSLADATAAMGLFQAQFPDATGTAILTRDRCNALITLADGAAIGLLQAHGQRWNARVLRPGDVASIHSLQGTRLQLRFSDYGSPRASLEFADARECADWLARLQRLTQDTSAPGGVRHSHA
jgi:hypothetical protein